MTFLDEALARFRTPPVGESADLRLSLRDRKFARVRLAILSAVLHLTRERALADIAVREICTLAQVAPATFFNYFPSKEEVLVYYMRLWSIPVILQCRALAAQKTPLAAIRAVFDYTAHEIEQHPRLMFEIIAYIAQAREAPQAPSISLAERLLAFPDLLGAEMVEPQALDELFPSLIEQALVAEELLPASSVAAIALLLKTIFYGVPLATRREGEQVIHHAYHEALDILLNSAARKE
jgi:AcrR family transcriptional regulator